MLFITYMKWKGEVVIGLKCEEKINHNKLLRELLTYKKLCKSNDYIQEIQVTAENKIEEEKIWARYLFWNMSIYRKQAHVHIFFNLFQAIWTSTLEGKKFSWFKSDQKHI